MFGVKTKVEDKTQNVAKEADKAAFKNFGHAAASISKDAKASIKKDDGPAPAGSPPHTHKGVFFRKAIRFAAGKWGAVIGPRESVVGTVGAAHEFGHKHHGQDFDERPTMGPALERAVPRIAGQWRGSIGQ